MHLAIAYSTEIIRIYAAKDLRAGQRKLDEGEFLDVFTASVTDFLENCRKGAVTDAKTLSCALWLQNIQSGVWALDWKALS
jgi:ADP-ribose pyrophosphatase